MLKKVLYGQKSEKTQVIMEDAEQLSLFNEAEENSDVNVIKKDDKNTVVTHERRKHSTHKDTFENLEAEEVIHKTEDKACPECGSEMEVIGKEFVRDELVYVPARMFVRKNYAACGAKLSRQTMSNWVIWAAVNKAKPVFDIMKETLLKLPVIHADETVVQVLRRV